VPGPSVSLRHGVAAIVIAAVTLIGASLVAALSASAAGWGGPVHLRGTAYEFNNVHALLAGATIRLAEFPNRSATVRADGTYDLAVPDHARVTPYIVDPGYHTIYLQTFTTAGENLANVNFQTPTQIIYRGLASLLNVPTDPRGNPRQCAIVSTFSTRNVRDLSFQGFVAYGAHGVAGATATSSPALPAPVYFNRHVIPDPTQKVSSEDGGVVWTRVPAGIYTITAHRRGARFASFVATCRPGRIVNANPPWGLHELGLANPARISSRWSSSRSRATLQALTVRALPPGAKVRVACSGRACRFSARTFRPRAASFDLARALGTAGRRYAPGEQLEVTITAHRFDGKQLSWTIAGGRVSGPATGCIPLGDTIARARC
jgi:hypothetical protein